VTGDITIDGVKVNVGQLASSLADCVHDFVECISGLVG
jgi:hypothetical protein